MLTYCKLDLQHRLDPVKWSDTTYNNVLEMIVDFLRKRVQQRGVKRTDIETSRGSTLDGHS